MRRPRRRGVRLLSQLARVRRDHDAMLANLTATQVRCSSLLEEARAARRDLAPMADLVPLVAELGPDERRVLLVLARRLLAGQGAYGKLDVASDPRNWRKEASEEAADLLVYLAIWQVATGTP